MSINTVTISGNLTRDAELRAPQADLRVLAFSVAVNDYRRGRDGEEWEEYPNYVDCSLFGSRAPALCSFLRKGTKVCVKGRLRWRSWEKDGARRSKLEVVAEELEFLSPRRDGAPAGSLASDSPAGAGPLPPEGCAPDPAGLSEGAGEGLVDGAVAVSSLESGPVGHPPASAVYDEKNPF